MKYHNTKRGFTLIELLVVVLIIGILAAVAVPQYQKAVMKSRLTEVMISMNAVQKGINMYLLANGFPTELIRFSKENAEIELDIDLPCKSRDGLRCYTEHGEWSIACEATSCWIDTTLGAWAKGFHIATIRKESSQWDLYRLPTDLIERKIACQWWVNNYGTDQFYTDKYGNPAELCAEVGVQ